MQDYRNNSFATFYSLSQAQQLTFNKKGLVKLYFISWVLLQTNRVDPTRRRNQKTIPSNTCTDRTRRSVLQSYRSSNKPVLMHHCPYCAAIPLRIWTVPRIELEGRAVLLLVGKKDISPPL
mmetsp:Transcript_16818/g.25291  ORF Transcript_16818/g.25291 Transcript_16818/m.25291 type:complete len:121 (-) Transcript_16818:2383-2745(-)